MNWWHKEILFNGVAISSPFSLSLCLSLSLHHREARCIISRYFSVSRIFFLFFQLMNFYGIVFFHLCNQRSRNIFTRNKNENFCTIKFYVFSVVVFLSFKGNKYSFTHARHLSREKDQELLAENQCVSLENNRFQKVHLFPLI